MSTAPEPNRVTAWPAAARLIARWLDRWERVDELLDSLGGALTGAERARCQYLVFGAIRHFGRIDAALARLIAHPPRFSTRAVLLIAGFELIEAQAGGVSTTPAETGESSGEPGEAPGRTADPGLVAKIVHHAVEQTKQLASPAEARLVNAVVRKLAGVLAEPPPPKLASADVLAEYFSHPEWLVRSWLAQFGAAATRSLLEWNQQPAPVYARWRPATASTTATEPAAVAETPPAWFKPTAWAGYYEIPTGHWPEVGSLLKTGKIYLQDPAMRIPVELLAPQETEVVLDGCAAPGGKSLLIADTMGRGKVVAVDLPGPRIDRLKENLSRFPATVGVALVQGDLRENIAAQFKEHGLPREYAAVLLDVPCSNTGVMRHRVDVKWRLQEGDFRKHPRQQLALLAAAARLVSPGGRLVYATCSIDTEENEAVVREFLADRAGRWSLEAQQISRPWETGHDGAGAFLLRRSV